MTTGPDHATLRRRLEVGRLALAAVPSLMERYRAAKYVVDHRQEIQSALDYVNANTLPQAELEVTLDRSSATLRGIETTYEEVVAAKEAADQVRDIDVDLNPFNGSVGIDGFDIDKTREAFGHVRAAWGAKPDLDSISDLADAAERWGSRSSSARRSASGFAEAGRG